LEDSVASTLGWTCSPPTRRTTGAPASSASTSGCSRRLLGAVDCPAASSGAVSYGSGCSGRQSCWAHSTQDLPRAVERRSGGSRVGDTKVKPMSWARLRDETRRWEGRSGRVGPVWLLACILQVIGEPSCRGIPVDELVGGKLVGQGTRPPDMAAELSWNPWTRLCIRKLSPCRQGALLPAGGPPCRTRLSSRSRSDPAPASSRAEMRSRTACLARTASFRPEADTPVVTAPPPRKSTGQAVHERLGQRVVG